MALSHLATQVIANCPDSPIRDTLITQLCRQEPSWAIPGPAPANDDLTVRLVLGRAVDPAAKLAAKVSSTSAITKIMDLEKRLKVWLALAKNPHLSPDQRQRIYAYGDTLGDLGAEKLALALITFARTSGDDRVEAILTLLTAAPWIRHTKVGSSEYTDLSYSLGNSSATIKNLQMYADLSPSSSYAGDILCRVFDSSRFGENCADLPASVVLKLFTTSHCSPYGDCNRVCPGAARWATTTTENDAYQLVVESGCPTVAAALLAHYQMTNNNAAASKLSQYLISCIESLEYVNANNGYGHNIPRSIVVWLTRMEDSSAILDQDMARAILAALNCPTSKKVIDEVKFPEITPAAAKIMMECKFPQFSLRAAVSYTDPLKRAQAAAALVGDMESFTHRETRDLIPKLIEPDVLSHLAAIESDQQFRTCARVLWASALTSPDRNHNPDSFVTRGIAQLGASTLASNIAYVADQYLADLVARADSIAEATPRAKLSEAILGKKGTVLTDDVRRRLLGYVTQGFLLEQLPTELNQSRLIQPGELTALMAQPDPFDPSQTRLEQTTRDLARRMLSQSEYVPWLDEAIFLCPISQYTLGPGAWTALGNYFIATYGQNTKLWELGLGLLETWDGPLKELLEMVDTLS